MFDYDALEEAFARVEAEQNNVVPMVGNLTHLPSSLAVESFAGTDTKQCGAIHLAVLDRPLHSQAPDPERSGSKTPSSEPEQGQTAVDTLGDISNPACLREHVRAVLHGKDARKATPKSVMFDLESRLGLTSGTLQGQLALVKQLAVMEVRQQTEAAWAQEPPASLEQPFFKMAKALRRSFVPRRRPEAGSVEARISALLSEGLLEAAVDLLTDRLRQLREAAALTGNGARQPPALLVMRGHVHWRNLHYMRAHHDFAEAENLEPGGVASASLLALRYVLDLALDADSIPGHEELKQILREAVSIHASRQEALARALQILRPRTTEKCWNCNQNPTWARGSRMQIFDGTCPVPGYETYLAAEIGYRLLVNRSVALETAPLLVYYHGNGETAAEYDAWADIYEKLPCSIIVFDYRAYGWSSGKAEIGCLAKDPVLCMQQLPSLFSGHGLPWPWPAPLVLMGRSLGSIVVGRLIGMLPDMFEGLIIDSGIAKSKEDSHREMLDWCGKARGEVESAVHRLHALVEASLPLGVSPGQDLIAPLGTCDAIEGYRGPVLILHGRFDFIVLPENAKRNYEAALNACERQLVEVDADHNTCAGVSEYWRKQKLFLQRIMKKWQERRIA